MITARPKQITIIAALLVALAVISLVSTLASPMTFGGSRPQGGMPGGNPPGGNSQGNNGTSQGQAQGQNGNFQPRGSNSGGFSMFSIARSLGIGGQYMTYINIGIAAVGVILALVCAWFVWKQKRWALNLAIVLAIIFLLGALPGLFSGGGGMINWLQTGTRALSTLCSVVIVFMGILPSVRDSVS
jgi:hypothetical protein